MKKTVLLLVMLFGTFAFSQVTIGTGTSVDSNAGLSTPISNWYASSLSQFIYLSSEINASGNITGIQFRLNGTTSLTNSNDMIDVWIGHTTRTLYNPVISATGADWIPVATHSHVITNGSLVQAGSIVTFTFTTPFAYNGTDNLVITVDANELGNDGSGILFLQTAASVNKMSLMIRADIAGDNANPLNPPLNYTNTFTASSVQAKTTRPIITLQGITALGVAENVKSLVGISPNPVTNTLFFESDVNVLSAEIYTISGQLVMDTKLQSANNSIDVSQLTKGVYLINFFVEDGAKATQKFVKE
ncbi:MAG: T9SS type A sorting domain-containing protein [Bacteroidota bacterium]